MEQPLRQVYEQAGITEREITIENVHLIRSTNAVEISCTLAAPLPEERLRSFEDAMRALLPRYTPSFTYTVRPAEEATAPAPAAPTTVPVPPTAAVAVSRASLRPAARTSMACARRWKRSWPQPPASFSDPDRR